MSARVKVLVVIGQLEVGGTELHLLNVLPDVNHSPLEIIVYTMRGGGRLHERFERAGIRVISPTHHSRRWLGLMRTARHLLATWRRERPQVVHFFLPEAYLLGGLCSILAPRCRRIMSRRSLNAYQRKWPGVRVLERWLHARMDAVLANSSGKGCRRHAWPCCITACGHTGRIPTRRRRCVRHSRLSVMPSCS